MKEISGKVTSKGQLVIPAELRRKNGIKPGTKVHFLEDELGRIVLQPVTDEFIDRMTGCLSGSNLMEMWLKEHREEGKKDRF